MPETISYIGERAFEGCESLTEISFPESAEVDTNAFYNCAGLADSEGYIIVNQVLYGYAGTSADIVVPENVRIIDDFAFHASEMETVELNEGLQEIGAYSFVACSGLKSINIPASVEKIEEGAFRNDVSLETVTFAKGFKGTYEADEVFYGCERLYDADGNLIIER